MLGSADHTPYDLRFRLLDIPVRVNPWFWLIMLMISNENSSLSRAVTFVLCAFVSVLVHEYGHGLASRFLGIEPSEIVLYGMGGYCATPFWHLGPWQRFLVLVWGPGAGFVLMGLVLAGASSAFQTTPADLLSLIGVGRGSGNQIPLFIRMAQNPLAMNVTITLLYINFWWGVLNLLPIWPLDGGRIAEVILGRFHRSEATRMAHGLSILTAGGVALWCFSVRLGLTALWFAYFAYLNYQMYQSARGPFGSWRDG